MTDDLGKETGSKAESVTPSPTTRSLKHAARHVEGPSGPAFRKAAEAAKEQMEDNLRERSTPKLEELAERNPTAQEILEEREAVRTLSEEFNTYSDEQKEQIRQIPPENIVKNMAGSEYVDRKEAEEFLRSVYEGKSDEEIGALLAKFDEQRAQIQPAPEEEDKNEFGTREDGAPITADEFVRDNQEALEQLADQGRSIMNKQGEEKERAIEKWNASLAGIFGENAGKALGKLMKYTTITSGILIILLMFFISWHTPSK